MNHDICRGEVFFRMSTGLAPLPSFRLVLTVCVASLIWQPSNADNGNASFPELWQVGDTELQLRGEADFVYGWFFKIYRGGLYLPAGVEAKEALAGGPVGLKLIYARNLSAKRLVEAGDKVLRELYTERERAAFAEELASINAVFEDVEKGDSYSLRYSPQTGLHLAHNGRDVHRIENPAFGPFYLAIWLGEHPLTERFRQELYGEGS